MIQKEFFLCNKSIFHFNNKKICIAGGWLTWLYKYIWSKSIEKQFCKKLI